MSISLHAFALSHLVYFCTLVVKLSLCRPLFMLSATLATIYFFHSSLQYYTSTEYTYASGAVTRLFAASDCILITDAQCNKRSPHIAFCYQSSWHWLVFWTNACLATSIFAFHHTHKKVFMTYMKSNPSFAINGYSLGADGIFWRMVSVVVVGLTGIACWAFFASSLVSRRFPCSGIFMMRTPCAIFFWGGGE